MGIDPPASTKRGADRIDLHRAVTMRFAKFQDFLTEVAANISPTGMFVSSDAPHAPGEQFEFECSLADGYPLVSGRAEVVWVRRQAISPDQPSGMGVKFVQLLDNSESLIRRIVDERIKRGEKTFELAERRRSATAPADHEQSQVSLAAEIQAAADRVVEESRSPAQDSSSPAEPFELEPTFAPPAKRATRDGTRPPEVRSAAAPEEPRPEAEEPEKPRPAKPAEKPPGEPSKGPVPIPESLRELRQSVPPEPAPESTPAVPAQAGVGVKSTRKERIGLVRFLELLIFSLITGICVVLLFNQYWVRPRIDGLEARLDELTGSSQIGGPPGFKRAMRGDARQAETGGTPPEGAQEPASAGLSPAAAPDTGSGSASGGESMAIEDVPTIVQAWARAWSEGRIDDYLGHYSEGFVPASGATFEEWRRRRRERLEGSGAIRVALVSLEVGELAAEGVRVTFTQSYQSSTFRDRVRKTLRMVPESGTWKIAEEIVTRQLPW